MTRFMIHKLMGENDPCFTPRISDIMIYRFKDIYPVVARSPRRQLLDPNVIQGNHDPNMKEKSKKKIKMKHPINIHVYS